MTVPQQSLDGIRGWSSRVRHRPTLWISQEVFDHHPVVTSPWPLVSPQ